MAPSQVSAQPPPPYVGPPQPQDWQKIQNHGKYMEETKKSEKIVTNDGYGTHDYRINDNRTCYGQLQQRRCPQEVYTDNRKSGQTIEHHHPYYEPPRYGDNRQMYAQQMIQAQNAKNHQFYSRPEQVNQQFYTLPTRRPQREAEPPRSVTPDITRGLGRGPLSAMHMLARHNQKPGSDHSSGLSDSSVDLSRKNVEQNQGRSKIVQNQQQLPVDVRNR